MSRYMQFIFGDKVEATCVIRECPTCDWKRGEGRDSSCETDGEIQIGMTDRYRGTKVCMYVTEKSDNCH